LELAAGGQPCRKNNSYTSNAGFAVLSESRDAWKMRQYPLKTDDVQHIARQVDLHRSPPQRITAQIF
jgi:hypothetical protein